ncbi:MAG: riboflavin synthase [Oscillospiraceae bacterium]|nr:riboflavin synthase [Oscillospiraceae bacterium]
MFTGIIEETGYVRAVQKGSTASFIKIEAKKIFEDMHIGDSIAVNGVCLTVTGFSGNVFTADVMNETLSRSSLGSLKAGSIVNLERAMAAKGRFGGHIVTGHIDGTGTISEIEKDGIALWYTVTADKKILRYIVEKGSVAIDGISLTVAKVTENSFSVSVIPHTAAQTALSSKGIGDTVNLENDIVGKYVEKLLSAGQPEKSGNSGITREFLSRYGF